MWCYEENKAELCNDFRLRSRKTSWMRWHLSWDLDETDRATGPGVGWCVQGLAGGNLCGAGLEATGKVCAGPRGALLNTQSGQSSGSSRALCWPGPGLLPTELCHYSIWFPSPRGWECQSVGSTGSISPGPTTGPGTQWGLWRWVLNDSQVRQVRICYRV